MAYPAEPSPPLAEKADVPPASPEAKLWRAGLTVSRSTAGSAFLYLRLEGGGKTIGPSTFFILPDCLIRVNSKKMP